jgi:hypothetical protein
MTNKIGVAIPTYNREDQLCNLLEIIPKNIPIYVSDNGNCLSINFKEHFEAVTFRSISGAPVPPLENWNIAAKMVKEEWVVIPSDDDVYYKNSFKIIEKYLEEYSSADIVIFGHNVIDKNYKKIYEWKPKNINYYDAPNGFNQFKYGVDARMPSIFFKTKFLEKLGFFDESFKMTAGDSDLVQRALINGISVFVPQVVSGYRVWTDGSTHKTIGTAEWMQEIDKWGKKIEEILLNIPQYHDEASTIRAEIYARNLSAGITNNKKTKGWYAAWGHMNRCNYPYKALVRTQLRILVGLIRP